MVNDVPFNVHIPVPEAKLQAPSLVKEYVKAPPCSNLIVPEPTLVPLVAVIVQFDAMVDVVRILLPEKSFPITTPLLTVTGMLAGVNV